MPDVIPQKIDLATVPVAAEIKVDDHSVVVELPLAPLPKAGYKLSRFILWVIAGYILFLILFILFARLDASDKIDVSGNAVPADSVAFAHKKELITALQQEKKSSRDFIIQVSQMVLLNLLLPTLTAILGYIFGTREEAKRSNNNNPA